MDWDKYQAWMDEHGQKSGAGTVAVMGNDGPIDMLKQEIKSTPFVGYESTSSSATVKGCGTTDERMPTLATGSSGDAQQFIVLDQTPFYAKSGGQESDAGKIVGPNGAVSYTHLTLPTIYSV